MKKLLFALAMLLVMPSVTFGQSRIGRDKPTTPKIAPKPKPVKPKSPGEDVYQLANRFLKGTDGYSVNLEVAAGLFREAADKGHSKAKQTLGLLYLYGFGVDQDYEEALRWFNAAGSKSPYYKIAKELVDRDFPTKTKFNANLIFFYNGENATLYPDENQLILDIVAQEIKSNYPKEYEIVGYSDNLTGTEASNQRKREERANKVSNYLVEQCGVSSSQLHSTIYPDVNVPGYSYLNNLVAIKPQEYVEVSVPIAVSVSPMIIETTSRGGLIRNNHLQEEIKPTTALEYKNPEPLPVRK